MNQFVAHELDRCDVSTGARGLDIILNYALNEASVFVLVPLVSFFVIAIFFWLTESVGDNADRIERQLEHSKDDRARRPPWDI